jgi:Cytochrome P450
LVSRLRERSDAPTNMFLALRSTTLDIITAYMFGHCIDALDYPDFCNPLLLDIQAALPILWIIKAFPWLVPGIALIPAWLGGTLYNQYRAVGAIRQYVHVWLNHIKREAETSDELRGFTICHRLLHPSVSHHYDLQSTQYLLDEALSLLQAGSDTVGNTCTVGTFYVLNDKLVLSNLFEELRSIWPDQDETIELATLQTLPYLVIYLFSCSCSWLILPQTAVIKESLRLSHGFVTPLPRVVGPLGAEIADWQVPANVCNASPPTPG